MADRPLRYAVLKYVPDAVSYEPINVGCIVFSPDLKERAIQITRQAGRLVDTRGLDAGSKALKLLFSAVQNDLENAADETELLSALDDYGTVLEVAGPFNSDAGPADDVCRNLYARFVSFESKAPRRRSIGRPSVVSRTRNVLLAEKIEAQQDVKITTPVRPVHFDFAIRAGSVDLIQCISLDARSGSKITEIEAFAHKAERMDELATTEGVQYRVHAVIQPNRREPDLNNTAYSILDEVGIDIVENREEAIRQMARQLSRSKPLM